MEFYAHSKEGQAVETWQTLPDHLSAVAKIARGFAEAFGSGDWAHNAAWLHDLGKTPFKPTSFGVMAWTTPDMMPTGVNRIMPARERRMRRRGLA